MFNVEEPQTSAPQPEAPAEEVAPAQEESGGEGSEQQPEAPSEQPAEEAAPAEAPAEGDGAQEQQAEPVPA